MRQAAVGQHPPLTQMGHSDPLARSRRLRYTSSARRRSSWETMQQAQLQIQPQPLTIRLPEQHQARLQPLKLLPQHRAASQRSLPSRCRASLGAQPRHAAPGCAGPAHRRGTGARLHGVPCRLQTPWQPRPPPHLYPPHPSSCGRHHNPPRPAPELRPEPFRLHHAELWCPQALNLAARRSPLHARTRVARPPAGPRAPPSAGPTSGIEAIDGLESRKAGLALHRSMPSANPGVGRRVGMLLLEP